MGCTRCLPDTVIVIAPVGSKYNYTSRPASDGIHDKCVIHLAYSVISSRIASSETSVEPSGMPAASRVCGSRYLRAMATFSCAVYPDSRMIWHESASVWCQ